MKLLVAVETFVGTFIAISWASTLSTPAPIPSKPEDDPGGEHDRARPGNSRHVIGDVALQAALSKYDPFKRRYADKRSFCTRSGNSSPIFVRIGSSDSSSVIPNSTERNRPLTNRVR